MNNCLIMFGISFMFMLIAEIIKRLSVQPKNRLYIVDTWADHLSGCIFVIGWVIFFVTLIFAIYIFIFIS